MESENYIAKVMGLPVVDEAPVEPTIRKVSAIALLKGFEVRDQNILVLTRDFVEVAEEIKGFLGKSVAVSRRQDNMVTIETATLNRFYVLTDDQDRWGIKGVRAQILIVDGKREDVNYEFFHEVVLPMSSVIFNPHISARLSEACGEQIHPFARRVEIIFSGDLPY